MRALIGLLLCLGLGAAESEVLYNDSEPMLLRGGRPNPDAARILVKADDFTAQQEDRSRNRSLLAKNGVVVRLYTPKTATEHCYLSIANRRDAPQDVVITLSLDDELKAIVGTVMPGGQGSVSDTPWLRDRFHLPLPPADYSIRIIRVEPSRDPQTIRRGAKIEK